MTQEELKVAAAEAQLFVKKTSPGDGVCSIATTWPDGPNGEPVITIYVDKKKPKAECGHPVDAYVVTDGGHKIKTEVVELGEPIRSLELIRRDGVVTAQAAPGYDKIYNKIVGGLQIAPDGANWVGTLGGIFMATIDGNTIHAGLTNAHVTGLHAPKGTLMMQPDRSYQAGGFGSVAWVSKFSNNNDNLMDAGIIDCHAKEGKWLNNERWTVHPEQFGGYKLSLKWKDAHVGMKVLKYGRTTGFTKARCISIGADDFVNYGQDGTFGFVKMDHYETEARGNFSAGGDSGSYIVEEATGDLVSHLFAGGGTLTIGYPIRHLMEKVNGRLAENPPN